MRDKEQPHHQPRHARRRQLRHRAQSHRAQAHLAHRLQKIGPRQPPRRNQCARHRRPAGGIRIANAIAPNSRPQANLAGLDGSCFPSAIHSQANAGARIMTKSDGTNWNQLGGKSNPKQHVTRAPLGEKIQRRAALLIRRPKHRRRHEQHQNRARPLALDHGPSGPKQQPRENRHATPGSRTMPSAAETRSAVISMLARRRQHPDRSQNQTLPPAQPVRHCVSHAVLPPESPAAPDASPAVPRYFPPSTY